MQEPEELTIKEFLNKIKDGKICFRIPGFQRGYKWGQLQASQLIDDLEAYGKQQELIDGNGEYDERIGASAYYLQPISVCPSQQRESKDETWYDVIDGQQRLTTIWLLLYTCCQKQKSDKIAEPTFILEYESFANWQNDFKCKATGFKQKSLNHYHIQEVYETFNGRISKLKATGKIKSSTLYQILINHTKIIWSDISSQTGSREDDIKTFTNLNSGKIPLTCGELIKGLVLQKSYFMGSSSSPDAAIPDEDQRLLSAIQKLIHNSQEAKVAYDVISRQWDEFERDLHDERLWHFIYNKGVNYTFDTRLEYIFNLVEGVNKEDDSMQSFYNLYARINANDSYAEIDKFWKLVVKYMATIKEWFKDKEYYHLIGYLVTTVPWIKQKDEEVTVISYLINGLYQDNWTKQDLRKEIKSLILESLEQKDLASENEENNEDTNELENLRYSDTQDRKAIRRYLLFFNIHTILMQEGEERFPFNRYKEENWDIEHIASQTDFNALKKDTNEAKLWALYVLQYFTGLDANRFITMGRITKGNNSFIGKQMKELDEAGKQLINDSINSAFPDDENPSEIGQSKRWLCQQLKDYIITGTSLEYSSVKNNLNTLGLLGEFEEDEKQEIGNLTLLNMSINRGYGNAIFPVKRMIIQEELQHGYFVPPCTQRVFHKAYSRRFDQLYKWDSEDAAAYLDSIKDAIRRFKDINGSYAEYKSNKTFKADGSRAI